MALNTYIDSRLWDWAMFADRRDSGGLGYKRQVNYHFDETARTNFAGTPEFDEQCYEIDQCVVAVRATDERSYKVLMLRYRTGGEEKRKAKEMGCCEETYRARVAIAQRLVQGFLGDLHCDIALPKLDWKANDGK